MRRKRTTILPALVGLAATAARADGEGRRLRVEPLGVV